MRALRYLLLLGAAGIAFFAYQDYQEARGLRGSTAKAAPEALERDLNSRSSRWQWEQSTGDSSRLMVSADGFSQGRDDGAIDLQGVELRISRDASNTFDLIRTEQAVFHVDANQLQSQAETFITLGVDADDQDEQAPDLTRIIAAEAIFDTRTGAAQTTSATRYFFEGGEARSTGSFYDSASGLFEMQSNVEVDRFAASPGGQTTRIRAGSMIYDENADRVNLRDGVSMDRAGRRVDAESAVLQLEDGKLRRIFAVNAAGGDEGEARQTNFRTPNLEAYYDAEQRLEQVVGQGASSLTARSATSVVQAAGERIELRYQPDPAGGDSLLDEAVLNGGAEVDARPTTPGQARRRVTSEAIRLEMRPDGQELAMLETMAPGRIELTPVGGGAARTLEAERVRAHYGSRSRLKLLEGRGEVRLTSQPPNAPALLSWSNTLDARFSPESGELAELVQRGAFRFEQGERSGQSESAVWDPAQERLAMEGKSKIRDAAGVISAHRIVLVDGAGRIEAQGGVSSVFEGEQADKGANDGLFRQNEPVYATAARMQSDSESGLVVYEGEARLWQGRNRIQADVIRIDRQRRILQAQGKVVSLLKEVREGAAEPSMVKVVAQSMEYQEDQRLATYTGAVRLERTDLRVFADELVARLRPADAEGAAGLESAQAEGGVRIEETTGARRAEAHTADLADDQQTVVLRGDPARAWNEAGEETRGAELTWSSGSDSLRVSGGDGRAYTFRRQGR